MRNFRINTNSEGILAITHKYMDLTNDEINSSPDFKALVQNQSIKYQVAMTELLMQAIHLVTPPQIEY